MCSYRLAKVETPKLLPLPRSIKIDALRLLPLPRIVEVEAVLLMPLQVVSIELDAPR
jgi:hypothetical protein